MRVLNATGPQPRSCTEIMEELRRQGHPATRPHRWLRSLLRAGLLEQSGRGVPNFPYLYSHTPLAQQELASSWVPE